MSRVPKCPTNFIPQKCRLEGVNVLFLSVWFGLMLLVNGSVWRCNLIIVWEK